MKNLRLYMNKKVAALISAGVVLIGSLGACTTSDNISENDKIINEYIDENNNDDYNFYDVFLSKKIQAENIFKYDALLKDKKIKKIINENFVPSYIESVDDIILLSPEEIEALCEQYNKLDKKNSHDNSTELNDLGFKIQTQLSLSDDYVKNQGVSIIRDYILLMAKKYAAEMITYADPLEMEIHYTINQGSMFSKVMLPSLGEMYSFETTLTNQDENNFIKLLLRYENVSYMKNDEEVDVSALKSEYDLANEIMVTFINREEENKIKVKY